MSPEVKRIALALYEANGTPLSLSCFMLLKYGEYDQLVRKQVDPGWYNSRDAFFLDNSSVSFLKKYPNFKLNCDPSAAAISTFFECERANAVTNRRLKHVSFVVSENWRDHPEYGWIIPIVRRIRSFASHTLGRLPDFLEGRFGPGATFFDKGRESSILHKLSSVPTLTANAVSLLPVFWTDKWELIARGNPLGYYDIVRGNRLTTVPKTSITDRPICVEPSLNIYAQLGLGSCIRRSLKRRGIDLKNGQSIHTRVLLDRANISTIDLSSASDTVSRELIRLILPDEWFSALDSLRSPLTQYQGRWYHQQKFSSMGNGFTFELETLVFLSIICGLFPDLKAGHDVFVYGDDLIIPSHVYDDVVAALRFFGFTPNMKKSFKNGRFRESCGMDVFDNIPSRAYYLKGDIDDPQTAFSVLNGIRKLSDRYSGDYRDFDRYRRPWLRALDCVPVNLRKCIGPFRLGDLCINEHDPSPSKEKDCISYFRVLRPKVPKIPLKLFSRDVQMAGCLYGAVASIGIRDYVPIRGRATGYKVGYAA